MCILCIVVRRLLLFNDRELKTNVDISQMLCENSQFTANVNGILFIEIRADAPIYYDGKPMNRRCCLRQSRNN